MKCSKVWNSRMLFGFFNALFMINGLTLLIGGFLLLCDTSTILLSKLINNVEAKTDHPPLYYVALVLMCAGLVICADAALGCWTTYSRGFYTLTLYFIIVFGVLLCQCASCVLLVIKPSFFGLHFDQRSTAVEGLQSSYGIPDHEQYTVALDLAQSKFRCCGITDSKNYDISLWQLRRLGPRDLIVPLTCCVQSGSGTHLNPNPINQSLCNELTPISQYRYLQGCYPLIEQWYQQHYIIYLATTLLMAVLEFGVLLSTVITCSQMKKERKTISHYQPRSNENIYESKIRERPITAKYVQPNNFYSPSLRNPNMFANRPNEQMA